MRDAFGGTFMIQIFLVFIFIYICFTGVVLNYARAFKVKSAVIEYLEKNEILGVNQSGEVDLKHLTAREKDDLNQFIEQEVLTGLKYSISDTEFCSKVKHAAGEPEPYCHPIGIIIRQSASSKHTEGIYYTVYTYVDWNTGFLSPLLSLGGNSKNANSVEGTWEISGQTRIIVRKNPIK